MKIAIPVAALAAVFRLGWPTVVEFKGDQAYSLQAAISADPAVKWAPLGMPSSAGLPNPGASVWVFTGLAAVTGATSPAELSWSVGLWNLLGLAMWAWALVRLGASGAWWWGLAALAVAPHAVRYHRVIWAQSMLLPWTALGALLWPYRHRWWGGAALGFLAVWIGQIHMPAWFLSVALGCGILIWDRSPQRLHRGWASLGGLVAMVPLWPWLEWVFTHPSSQAAQAASGHGTTASLASYLEHLLSLKFLLLFVSEPFTDGFRSVLGTEGAWDFFWESAPLQVGLASLGVVTLGVAYKGRLRGSGGPEARNDQQALWVGAAFYGAMLTLAGFVSYRHYLEAIYPLPYVAVAVAWQHVRPSVRTPVMVAWVVLLAGLSWSLLSRLESQGGAPGGDFGRVAETKSR